MKKTINSKKTKTIGMPIDVAELERMKKPSYRFVSKGLTKNATPLEKSKHEIQQSILRYSREKEISDAELKKILKIKQSKFDYLLFSHLEHFTLDELVDYASELFTPFHLGVIPEKSLLFAHKESNNRVRKHA
ncbi:MAG: helix-turn-helix domain-containing protein [Spiroplasmataceae bacterium]|jgi:predicted XRE-type DNA-binding protein|nr:helix-turn-helix domain-containing protein [Spiroplasmataceae bacterium]